jgi:DNA-binding NarL/FixJ family response regulator
MLTSGRVLLADDHRGMQTEIRLQLDEAFEVIGAVEDGQQAVNAVLNLDPDVMVLDIEMPVMNGFQVAARLRGCRTKIVILTTYDDQDFIDAAFSSGANGYVTKRNLGRDLVTAIHEVLRGNTFVSPSLA